MHFSDGIQRLATSLATFLASMPWIPTNSNSCIALTPFSLTSPSLIFWLALLASAWLYVLKFRAAPFVVADREVPQKAVLGVLGVCTFLALDRSKQPSFLYDSEPSF